MKFDLHTHSKYSSDGLSSPKAMVRRAKKIGIGLAITDHDNIDAWEELKSLSKEEKVPVIFGEEIKTTFNGEGAGEIIGLFLNEAIKAREYPEVIEEIKGQDGLVVVPHPFDVWRKNFKFLGEVKGKVDGLEVLNARCWREKFNREAETYAFQNGLNKTAGSDAHTPGEIGQAIVASPAHSLEDFRKDLLKNRVRVIGNRSSTLVHLWTPVAKLSPYSLYRIGKRVVQSHF